MKLFQSKKTEVKFVNPDWLKWKMAYNGIDDFIDNIMSDLKSAVLDLPHRQTGNFGIIFRVGDTIYEVRYQLFNEKGKRCVKITKADPVDMENEFVLNLIKDAVINKRNSKLTN